MKRCGTLHHVMNESMKWGSVLERSLLFLAIIQAAFLDGEPRE